LVNSAVRSNPIRPIDVVSFYNKSLSVIYFSFCILFTRWMGGQNRCNMIGIREKTDSQMGPWPKKFGKPFSSL